MEQIAENPYLRYFLGLSELLEKPLFDPSMMVHFRSRFSAEHHQRINAKIIAAATASDTPDDDDSSDRDDGWGDGGSPSHAGNLLVDATCTPADIRFPTDLSLLNEARKKAEAVIDQLYGWNSEQTAGRVKKPRMRSI